MGTPFKLQNGLLLLSTEAPGGVYNSAQLKKIAALADGETAVIKATEDQRLALFVQANAVAKVTQELKAVGLGVRNYQDGLHQPVNCLGELCPDFAQDAMGASMDIAQELKAVQLATPLKIGINGCGRCCVATHTLDISIVGDTNGYRISLGGKNSQIPEMASFMAEGIPAGKLPKLVAKVIAVYKELAQTDESLQDVMERAGSKKFIDALHPYSQDAAHSDPFAGVGETADAGGAAAAADDMKIDGLPAAEELGDMPSVGDGLGADAADLSGPNFDDLAPEADAALGLEAPEAMEAMESMDGGDELTIGSLADASLADDVPIGDDLAMTGELAVDTELTAGEDGLVLEDQPEPAVAVAVEDELVLEDVPAAATEGLAMDDLPADMAPVEELALDAVEDDSAAPAPLAPGGGDDLLMDELTLDAAAVMEADSGDLSLEGEGDVALSEDVLAEAASAGELDFEVATEAPAAVAAAPTAAEIPAEGDDFDKDMAADEVGEDEADAFEAKLNESIAEEEGLPAVEDPNAGNRLEAMRLVEANADLPSVDAVQETLETDGSFDDLEIDHDMAAEPEVMGEEIGNDEEMVSDELVSDEPAPSSVFEFTGVDMTADGRVAIKFASGANIAIDPSALGPGGRRDLVMGGKKISLRSGPKGLSVEVDGVAIFLPRRAA